MEINLELKPQKNIINFFSNPVVGILGSIASLIGLALAVIFYFVSLKNPNLVYSIHPSKNILINSDIPSNLSVSYKGIPIKGKDVVAVTLSIWNDGKQSIRHESILEKVNIKFSPEVSILEANVTKLSRNVIGLNTINDENSFSKGVVPLEWKILEYGDGGNLQVIYSGSRDANISITGVIEGQGEIKRLSAVNLENSTKSLIYNTHIMKWLLPGIILSSVTLVMFTFFFADKFRFFPLFRYYPFKDMPTCRDGIEAWIGIVFAIAPFVCGSIYIFLKLEEWYPPFGF